MGETAVSEDVTIFFYFDITNITLFRYIFDTANTCKYDIRQKNEEIAAIQMVLLSFS